MLLFKLFKNLFGFALFLLGILFLYILTAFCFTFFPAKYFNTNIHKNKSVYIRYDEMHSDIILDLNKTTQTWSDLFPTLIKSKQGYLAFGWGDKETYLNTPTWDDLAPSTALKALLTNSPSLMHVGYYRNIQNFQNIKIIRLSKEQQQALENAIIKSFDFKGKTYKGYRRNDLFYTSPYHYNLINTCNTWTGDTLRDANISVSYWTPFSQNVIYSLP